MLLQTGEHSDLNLECGKTRWNCHKAIVWSRCPKFADHETEMFDLHQGYEEATDVLLVWLYTLDKSYVQSVLRDHAQEKLRTTLVLLELTQVYDIKDDRLKDTILDLIAEFFEKAIAALDTADGRSRTKITDIVQMLGEVLTIICRSIGGRRGRGYCRLWGAIPCGCFNTRNSRIFWATTGCSRLRWCISSLALEAWQYD